MTEEIKPALTAEEWAEETHKLDMDLRHGIPKWRSLQQVGQRRGPHAAAALYLLGEPEGFSGEDLRVLGMASHRYGFCTRTESCAGCDACNADWERFLSIHARIAALLPPETP